MAENARFTFFTILASICVLLIMVVVRRVRETQVVPFLQLKMEGNTTAEKKFLETSNVLQNDPTWNRELWL